jgi:NDP-sugar pyrophosphorylase family protein
MAAKDYNVQVFNTARDQIAKRYILEIYQYPFYSILVAINVGFELSVFFLCLQAYLFDGYWEDIGTIKSFFEANLALTDQVCFCSVSSPIRGVLVSG